MPNDWKVGDLAKVHFSGKKLVVCISQFYHRDTVCIVNVMDNTFGSDHLTVKTESLESVDE